LYTALRRRITWLTSERGILLYQVVSTVVLTAVGVITVSRDPSGQAMAGLVAAIALHGIYSLSFFELWSLAEGSYSLRILEHVEVSPPSISRGALWGHLGNPGQDLIAPPAHAGRAWVTLPDPSRQNGGAASQHGRRDRRALAFAEDRMNVVASPEEMIAQVEDFVRHFGAYGNLNVTVPSAGTGWRAPTS